MNFVLIVFALMAFARAQNDPSTVSESAPGINESQNQVSEGMKNAGSSGVTDNTGRNADPNLQNGGYSDLAYQNFNGFNGQPNYDNLGGFKSFSDYSQSIAGGSVNSGNSGLGANFGADSAQAGAQSDSSLRASNSGSESSAANGDSAAKAKNTANAGEISGANFPFANSVFSTPASYDNGFGFSDSNLYNAGLRAGDSPFANFEKIITSNGPAGASTKSGQAEGSSISDDASQQENKYSNNLAAIPNVSDDILNGSLRSRADGQDSGSNANNEFDSSFSGNQQTENESSSGSARLNEEMKGANEETSKNAATTEASLANPTLASFAPSDVGRFDASLFGSNFNYPQFNSFNGFDSSIFSTATPLTQNSLSQSVSTTATPSAAKSAAAAVPTSIPSDAVTISAPEVTIPTPTGKTTVDTSIVKSGLPALSQLSLSLLPQNTLSSYGSTIAPFINGGSQLYPSLSYPLYDSLYLSPFLQGSNLLGGSFGIGAPIQPAFPQFPSFPTTPSPITDSSTFQPPNSVTISGDSVSVSAPNVESSVPTPVDKPIDPPGQRAETTPQPDEQVVEIAGSSMKSVKVSTESELEKTTSKPSVEVTKDNAALNSAKLFADAAKLQSQLPLSFSSGFSETFPSFSGTLNPTFYNSDSLYASSTPSYFNSNPGDFGLSQFGFGNTNAFGSDLGSISTSNLFKKKRQS